MRISDWSSDVCSSDLVKTNVGHLEAAAGMAGLIKASLAIRYGPVPPNRHFETLNPHIALDGFPVMLPQAATPWPARGGGPIAGVSSFGFSGTNAHFVLAQAPAPAAVKSGPRDVHLVTASGATSAAARTGARSYADAPAAGQGDRKSVGAGKRGSGRGDPG